MRSGDPSPSGRGAVTKVSQLPASTVPIVANRTAWARGTSAAAKSAGSRAGRWCSRVADEFEIAGHRRCRSGGHTHAFAGDLDHERLALLQGVSEAPQLGDECDSSICLLEIPCR